MENLSKRLMKCTVMIGLMIIFMFRLSDIVRADFDSRSPSYTVDGYDSQLVYETSTQGFGMNTVSINANLSTMEQMCVPHTIVVRKCCANASYPRGNYVRVFINGNLAYYDETLDISYSAFGDGWVNNWVDITSYRSSSANVVFEYNVQKLTCNSCGATCNTFIMYRGLFFKDKRGTATFANQNYTKNAGESETICPNYSNEVSRVVWGIRYAGESGFTPLNEGVNARGLTVSGATARNITVSNLPCVNGGFDLGVFVYDADGGLPAGYDYPNTPFYTHFSIVDNEKPLIDVKKTIDTGTGTVLVTIIGSDSNGLSDLPYSFDGGATFVSDDTKAFTEAGTYTAVVKDAAGNTSTKEFYIDAVELKKANPSAGGSAPVDASDGETGGGKGTAATSGGGQAGGGSNTNREQATNGEPGTGSFSDLRGEKEEYVSGKPVTVVNVTNTEGALGGGKNSSTTGSSGSSKSTTGNKKKADLSPKEISDADSSDIFEKIKKNSEAYVISMKETGGDTEKYAAPDEEANISLSKLENDDNALGYADEGNPNSENYAPKLKKKSPLFYVIIIVSVLLLILLLIFFLFFGVIVFIEKETEFSEISDTEGIKIPVAITFVSYSDGNFSVCFRELLNKYGLVYARFGLLFSYMFEGERIKIMTRFKGEEKREIATEIIHPEIVVGNKGGSK